MTLSFIVFFKSQTQNIFNQVNMVQINSLNITLQLSTLKTKLPLAAFSSLLTRDSRAETFATNSVIAGKNYSYY